MPSLGISPVLQWKVTCAPVMDRGELAPTTVTEWLAGQLCSLLRHTPSESAARTRHPANPGPLPLFRMLDLCCHIIRLDRNFECNEEWISKPVSSIYARVDFDSRDGPFVGSGVGVITLRV